MGRGTLWEGQVRCEGQVRDLVGRSGEGTLWEGQDLVGRSGAETMVD